MSSHTHWYGRAVYFDIEAFRSTAAASNPECSRYHCVGQRWAHRGFQDPASEAALVAAGAQVGPVVKYSVRSPAGLTPVARPNFL